MEGFQQQQNQQRANKVLETKLKKKQKNALKMSPPYQNQIAQTKINKIQ